VIIRGPIIAYYKNRFDIAEIYGHRPGGSGLFLHPIWREFRGIGLIYNIVDGIQRASFDEIILRESDGFRELWDIDFPVENLSTRRQNARVG
jgi:hypothetical protein